MLSPIKDYPNLAKDTYSKAIVSTDKSGYKAALKRREIRKNREDEVSRLQNEVAELRSIVNALIANK
jgi:hypothetical protein